MHIPVRPVQVGTGRIDLESADLCRLEPPDPREPSDWKLPDAHIPEDRHQRVLKDIGVEDALPRSRSLERDDQTLHD